MNKLSSIIIPTEYALNLIFKTYVFEYLKEQIIDSGEVELAEETNYAVIYKNNNDFSNNVYSDLSPSSNLKWLAIYCKGTLVGLQLIQEEDNYVELIVIEKNNNIKQKLNIFEEVIRYCKEKYDCQIRTFPLNDKLKEYYSTYGFVDDSENYIMLQ